MSIMPCCIVKVIIATIALLQVAVSDDAPNAKL